MSRNRVSDPTSVLVEVGIARIVNARLDTPVPPTKGQEVGGGGVIRVATTDQMNESFLLMTVGEVDPAPVNGYQLSRKGEAEIFGRDRTALDLTRFDAPPYFLDRPRLRGKKPLGVTSGWHGPTEWVGCL